MLRHEDIAVHHKVVILSHLFEDGFEGITALWGIEERHAVETTAGDEVEVMSIVEAD
jgi:hypothetical protein